MTRFLQPVLSLFVGFALLLYGLIHSANHYPDAEHLRVLWQSMPSLIACVVFMLGVAAVVSGLVLLTSGVRGLRLRYRQIQQAYSERRSQDYDEESDYHPAYR